MLLGILCKKYKDFNLFSNSPINKFPIARDIGPIDKIIFGRNCPLKRICKRDRIVRFQGFWYRKSIGRKYKKLLNLFLLGQF